MIVLSSKLWDVLLSRHSTADFATRKRLGTSSCILSYLEVSSATETSYLSESDETLSLVPLYYDMCPLCYCTFLQTNTIEGLVICSRCGYVLDEHASTYTSYTEQYNGPQSCINKSTQVLPRVHASYTHKRLHHFRSWVKRIQGLETVYIKREEIQLIKQELLRYHINEFPSYREVRFILKRLGLQRYYNHIFYVMNKINGQAMITLTSEHEQELDGMFRQLQKPFSQFRGFRVNMLSYSYLLYKISEHLGWDELAKTLPKMISPLKIYRQDQIWKQVCEQIGIPFYKTVM